VTFNGHKSQIEYTYFIKDESGSWKKEHGTKYIENNVYVPNIEAVSRLRQNTGKTPELHKDLYGNPILSKITTKFYDKNPPEPVKNSKVRFGYDIHPTVKFLSENFEFNEDVDDIPPLRIQYMDIETIVDDGGFLLAWNVGIDREGMDRGGVTLISSYDTIDKKTTIFGINPYTGLEPLPEDTEYKWCKDERGLLRAYMLYLKQTGPEILSGWNCQDYDIPYILNRMVLLFGSQSLYHFGNGSAWIDNEKHRISIKGITIIDYMILYKKFELTPRRYYSLDYITSEEKITINGQGKIKYEGSIRNFYESDWNGFVLYCIQDARLVYELDNKKKLIDTFVMCCYMAGIAFNQAISNDVSWLRIHDAAIYRLCQSKGLEIPENIHSDIKEEKFAGAYVLDPIPGIYNYITIFDVNSLYPSCIRSLNISPETYRGQIIQGDITRKHGKYIIDFYDSLYLSLGNYEVSLLNMYNSTHTPTIDPHIGKPKRVEFESFEYLQTFLNEHNYCVAANGAIFTKEYRGIIPALLDHWIDIRKKNKKLYFEFKQKYQETGEVKFKVLSERYNTIQMVLKVRLNSLYGFVGTQYSRFYNRKIAEAVTATGQFVIKSAIHDLQKENNLLAPLYCDTDSLFLNYGKILQEYKMDISDDNIEQCVNTCLEIDKMVSEIINMSMNEICTNVMLTPNMYNFESEEVISRLLISSKKKYVARLVYDKTTYQYLDNTLKISGLDCKKSNYSQNIKTFLEDISIKLLDGATQNDIQVLLKEKFEELMSLSVDDISYTQGVKNLERYGANSTIHITDTRVDAMFQKKTPYHVIGALVMNALIDHDPDLREMDKIVEGEKGKIIFVVPTNLFGIRAIMMNGNAKWNDKLDHYFKLDIEYLFERLILGPLNPLFSAVGYNVTMSGVLGFEFLDTNNNYVQTLLF